MALEYFALILSFAALAIMAMLVGRLLATLIKIVLIGGLVFLLLTRIDWKHTHFCQARATHGNQAILSGLFCKP